MLSKGVQNLFKQYLFVLISGLLISLFAVTATAQTVTFSGRQIQARGQYQTTGDFNNDGKSDLATAGLDVEVLIGNGDGSFQANVRYPVGVSLTGITKGDFNGDAKLDLAVTLYDTREIALLLGNGDGTFGPAARFATNAVASPTALVAADFNGDGKLDVMTADQFACLTAPCSNGRTVTLFTGNGDGSFQRPQQIDVGIAPTRLALGDFDRNGTADVAIAAGLGKVFILLGNGDGTFRLTPEIVVMANVSNTDIKVGDFNSDTIQDLAVAVDAESKIAILFGNGDGSFGGQSLVADTLQQRPWTLATGDFNRDGRQDILLGIGDCCAAMPTGGAFGLMLGNGDGTFQPIVRYINPNNGTAGTGNIQLATIDPVVADFNGDGKPDMASMFYDNIGGTTQGLIVALNTSGVVTANPALGVMSIAPASVVGGTRAEVNVPLAAGTVAAGNISFTLSNNNPSVASFPFTTTAPPLVIVKGMTNLHFLVDTNTVTTTQTVTITVNNKSLGSRSVTLTVRPPTEPLAIGAIEMQPRAVFGGDSSTGIVRLVTGYVAPTGGAFVTLTNGSPSLISMPASVTIPAGQASAEFAIQTTATGVTTPVTVSGSYGGVTKSTTLTVSAPSQPVPIASVTLTPDTVVGGSNIGVRVLVTLAASSPIEGANIMLTSSRPDIAAVPRMIRTNFSGQTTAFTDFATAAVSAPTQVVITATFGGSTQSAVLNVTPPAATAPAISSLTLNPSSVAGGASAQGTITLSVAAMSPTTVTLASSSAPIVTVASSVTIPAGATSASFAINTASVSSQLNATITASLNGVSRTSTLTVTPAGDTVRITRAEYTASNRTLRVEATSTRTNATLQAFVTSSGQLVGTLSNNGGGKYSGQLNWSVNPQNITVRSSFGGSAQGAVAAR